MFEGLVGGAGMGAGLPLASGVSSAAGAYLQYRWNRSEAQRQRDWNERMSNTQWQRGVADMRAAGINPLVAFGGAPAGFPGGAAASAPTSPGVGVSSALEARMQNHQVRLIDSQKDKTDAEEAASRHLGQGLKMDAVAKKYAAMTAMQNWETTVHTALAARAEADKLRDFWRSPLGDKALFAREITQYGSRIGEILRDAALTAGSVATGFGAFRAGKLLKDVMSSKAAREAAKEMLRLPRGAGNWTQGLRP